MLSVRFEVGVSLLLAPAGADNRGPKDPRPQGPFSSSEYARLVAKLYIWDCRRNLTPPVISTFKLKVKLKYETEKFVCVKTNNYGQI